MNETRTAFNTNIEALRGFAALCVFIFHLIINSDFNLGYDLRINFFPYSPPGHIMVMIFFMLSGYVIGITNKSSADFDISLYSKKRLVRLYPIYVFSILLTILLFKESWISAIGSLFFVQNLIVDNLHKNHSLWSLNHEVLYYLLAIPVLFYKTKPAYILIALSFLLSISVWLYPFPAYMEAYIVGFSYWILGLWLSRLPLTGQVHANELLAAFLLLLSCEFLNLVGVLIGRIPTMHGSNRFIQGIVGFGDLSNIPVCLYVMLAFTGTKERLKKSLFYFVYGAGFLHLGYLVYSGSFFKTKIFILPAVFLFSALFVHFQRNLRLNISGLAWVGSISFALYVIHAPILFAFQYIPFLGGNTYTFFLRLIIIFPIVIWLSYILEKKIQPYFKNRFM